MSNSVEEIEGLQVNVKENALHINAFNGTVAIYKTDGTKVKEQSVQNSAIIELPKGVYIVSLGKKNLMVNIK